MDFFQHQTQARRRTLLLALYFLLALAGVTAAVNLVTVALVRLLLPGLASAPWLGSSPFWWVSLSTLSIMAYGSLRKAWQLRGGATALTALLSAREVDADAGDQPLRRLRNVTEEMAIASGLPVPRLFVLDSETGINAFVAGARPDQALLVVTRGALEQLSREELQGVVAHEFSHILNGDMRLNLQLMTALSGILAVGKVGEFLLQPISRRHRYQPLFFTGGVLMMTVGYAGLFFGRLIKAAISRQREHLADACAVQFTRQSEGLAGALIKIRNGGGSLLHSLYAEDISHMGFAETVSVHLRALLSSHPPLEQRLRALGPDWNARARVRALRAPRASQHIGFLDDANLGYARSLVASIPGPLRQALAGNEGAETILYALALGPRPVPPALAGGKRGERIQQVRQLGTRLRLPLLDLALPTLARQPLARRQAIIDQLLGIARQRGNRDLLCWALCALARTRLLPAKRLPEPALHRFGAVAADLQVVFSALAWAADSARHTAVTLFQQATRGLLPAGRQLLPPDRCTPERMNHSVARLNRLTPPLKSAVIDTAADLILADGRIQVAETELLRALCALLDSPMPPLFRRTR